MLLRVNDEFDGIWTSCGLRRRFRSCYGGFGFYNQSDIMTKMVWSQGGHIKLRLLYILRQTFITKAVMMTVKENSSVSFLNYRYYLTCEITHCTTDLME